MLLFIIVKKLRFLKSLIISSHFNILTHLPGWNRITKIALLVLVVERHKVRWNIKTILQFMVCNISIDFWKPQNKFCQKQGVVHKNLRLWNECGGPIEGHKHYFGAFLHFGCRSLLSETITCHVNQQRFNFEVFKICST